MSPDSWKNNWIITLTVVFPNIWQLWMVSVIVAAGRERCGPFLLLNEGRGRRNVSLSFRNRYAEKNEGLRTNRVHLSGQNLYPFTAKRIPKKSFPIHKTDKLEIPISLIPGQISQKEPLISTDRLSAHENSCDQSATDVRKLFTAGLFHLGEVAVSRVSRPNTHSDSTCRLKNAFKDPARCTPITQKRNKCRMSYAMYRILPRTQTSSSGKLVRILEMLAQLAAAGRALAKNCRVLESVFLVADRGFDRNRK